MKRLSSSSSTSSTSTSLNSGSGGNERRKRSSSCNDDEKMKMGSVKKGPWTAEEDEVLSEFIKREGEGGWRTLPQRAGLLRCGKSCRLRWMNYLRPSVKRGQITWDEEDLIVRMHRLLGNRWSLIAGRIPGRTDNEIKNYWNTHLSKKLISNGLDPRTHKPLINPLPPPFPPPPYTSGNPNNNNNNVIISHHNYITTTTVDEMIPLPATIATPTSDYECCDHVNNNKNDLMMSCSSLGDDEDYNDNDVIVDENGVCSLTAFLNSLINDCQFDDCDQLQQSTPEDNLLINYNNNLQSDIIMEFQQTAADADDPMLNTSHHASSPIN